MNGKQYNIKRDAWNADLHDAFTTVLKVRIKKNIFDIFEKKIP